MFCKALEVLIPCMGCNFRDNIAFKINELNSHQIPNDHVFIQQLLPEFANKPQMENL